MLVHVRQAIAFGIRFPIIRIAFQDQPLPRDVFLQPERAETRPLISCRGQGTDLPQFPLLIGFFQEMPWPNRPPIEQPFADAVSLCPLEDDGIRVNVADSYRCSSENQEVSLRS